MDDDLERELLARLLAEEDGAPDDVANLVWAACEGHDALAANLSLPVDQRKPAAAQSPFRFVLIDDPVQAMDPIRVDGLASILGDAGKTREVIVLSHDERLVEAVQRLQIPATVLRVERRGQSSVSLARQRVAHEAYLDDARKVAKSGLGPS